MFALLLVTDDSEEACLATRHLAEIVEFRRFTRIKVLLSAEQYDDTGDVPVISVSELECFDRLMPFLMKSGTVVEGACVPRNSPKSILDEAEAIEASVILLTLEGRKSGEHDFARAIVEGSRCPVIMVHGADRKAA